MNEDIALNPNKLVQHLKKPAGEFTKKDIIKFVEDKGIKLLGFRYVAGDGKLKTLNFVINSLKHLDTVLSVGERVDGSSLFPHMEASASDLYVVPRYQTAFVNPFTEDPSIDLLCSFYTSDGKPLDSSPENVVKKAHETLKKKTGMTFEAMGELEFYILSELDKIYPIIPQRGYQESHPFSKWGLVRLEAMRIISEIGGHIKYGHAEVGNIISGDQEMVQHEIEFLPVPVESAADQLVLAKWVVREVAYKYNLTISFAPKIHVGHAGSGLHVHMRLMKDKVNQLVEQNKLSDTARKLIAGLLMSAPSLTAFGNTVPTSYLRLVPHQEAPTSICWGDRNRSVLVRVPLGWLGNNDMIYDANPNEPVEKRDFMHNQTIEFRSPDGSANIHYLMAGITMAVLHGIESPDALEKAKHFYKAVNVHKLADDSIPTLPTSCSEAADQLLSGRAIYEKNGVFSAAMIDDIARQLKQFNDANLSERLFGNGQELEKLVHNYLHCG